MRAITARGALRSLGQYRERLIYECVLFHLKEYKKMCSISYKIVTSHLIQNCYYLTLPIRNANLIHTCSSENRNSGSGE